MRNIDTIRAVLEGERLGVGDTNHHLSTNGLADFESVVEAAVGQGNVQYKKRDVQLAKEYTEELISDNQAVYGITTSFGGNIKHVIPASEGQKLQNNLIVSHSANVGTKYPYQICRAVLILRLLTLAKGYSGVSPKVIELMHQLLELGLTPVIPAHGSMGASGDLGPLSALARTLTGQGEMYLPDRTTIWPARKALAKYKLSAVELGGRDGLALINGTSVMTALGAFYLRFSKRLIENSLAVSALSIEALRASREPFDARLHKLKPHKYQRKTAAVMGALLKESRLALTHTQLKRMIENDMKRNGHTTYEGDVDLQGGSYSLRAIPQIYQPIMAQWHLFRESVNVEINAIDDNPVFLVDQDAQLHGANFHGHPISVTADALNTAMISVANTANARIDRLLKSHHSGLPDFLATGTEGLYLGLQGAQYTAAGICAEMRALAVPLSVNQISTNNDNQDIVSFGMQATAKGLELSMLLAYVMAVEGVAAEQAIWIRLKQDKLNEKALSTATRQVYKKLQRWYKPQADKDQSYTEVLEKVAIDLLNNSLLPKTLQNKLW